MKNIYIKPKTHYNLDVVKEKFIPFVSSLIERAINGSRYAKLFTYLKNTYGVEKSEITDAIIKSIKITTAGNYIIIYIDRNSLVTKNSKVNFLNIVHIMDFGNREIRGNGLITYIMNLIESNFVELCLVV